MVSGIPALLAAAPSCSKASSTPGTLIAGFLIFAFMIVSLQIVVCLARAARSGTSRVSAFASRGPVFAYPIETPDAGHVTHDESRRPPGRSLAHRE